MTARGRSPVLYLVACGARAAAGLAPFITGRQEDGWEVCVVATPSALAFMNAAAVTAQTGHVVRSAYQRPDEPDVLPPADAIIVAPATFNTINKWANGNSDTLALGLLNEAIGLALPIAAVPTPNVALAQHPAFINSITRLRSWGVRILYDPEVFPLPTPNMGPQAAALFPWMELARQSRDLLAHARDNRTPGRPVA
jgi:hypothetical protein